MNGPEIIIAELKDRWQAAKHQAAAVQAALADVLKIHKRVEDAPDRVYCAECCRTEYGGLELVNAEWPCPTVQAIRRWAEQ